MSSMTDDEKTSRILEDPNAVKHMDALFDVVNLHSCGKEKTEGRDWRSAASGVGPTADDADLLDALFAVIQSDPGAGGGCKRRRTKSWKERELPPSFFNAGSSRNPELNSAQREASEIQRAGETTRDDHASHSHTQSTAMNAAPSGSVLVADTPECLTFYIDKHMQCSVNLEPSVERRRRLARGRVQKYRCRKRRRKVTNKRDTIRIMKTESVC